MTVVPNDILAELFDPAKIDEIAERANEPDMNPATFRRDIGTLVLMLQQARHELATVHGVHIRDIRALAGAEEATRQALVKQIEEAKSRECTALCNDVETDRDELARELEKLRQEGTPGVMHEVDRAFYNVAIADRDRFAELFRRGGERRARLVTRLRELNYAEKLVNQLADILSGAMFAQPDRVSRDNIVDMLDLLVDRYRGHSNDHRAQHAEIDRLRQEVADLVVHHGGERREFLAQRDEQDELAASLRHDLAVAMAENSQLKMDLAAAGRALDHSDSLESVVLGTRIQQLQAELEATVGRATQVQAEAAEYRDRWERTLDANARLDGEYAALKITAQNLGQELEATRRAKQENDERFMGERDAARQELDAVQRTKRDNDDRWLKERDEANHLVHQITTDQTRLVNENHTLNTEIDKAGRELLRQREQLATQADLLSTWEQDYRTLESKHNGLLTASRAVGQQLAMALRHCDRARERRFADGELLHRAHGIIANAENFKHTLPCQHDHCKANLHEIVIGEQYPPEPIGDPAWRDAAHSWNELFHAREDAVRRPTASQADPLDGFVVRVINDGARERVELEHLGGTCRFEVSYQALPKTDTPLTRILNDAYGHILRHEDEPDDPAPASAEVSCDDICHPSVGACCGNYRSPSTEVDE